MSRGFLGLGDLSRDDQMRVGLLAVLALSLECVLEGLVSDALVRAWAFHAMAAGLVVWALIDITPWVVRTASATGVVAVGNEALMISEANALMRYLLPASVLFVTSSWVFQRSIATSLVPDAFNHPDSSPVTAAAAIGFDLPMLLPPPPVSQLQKATPFVIGSGALLAAYGTFFAPWISTAALFGLLTEQFTLSEAQTAWPDLGAPAGFFGFMASGAELVGGIALLVSIASVVVLLSRQTVLPRQVLLGGSALVALSAVMHMFVLAGLIGADTDVRVIPSAWASPVGYATASYGIWMSKSR